MIVCLADDWDRRIVLLVAATLFTRSVHHALTTDIGFDRDRVVSVLVAPNLAAYADASWSVLWSARCRVAEEWWAP